MTCICSANRVAFNRDSLGTFALNMDPNSEWKVTLSTNLPDGDYCNVITSDVMPKEMISKEVHAEGIGHAVPAWRSITVGLEDR